MYSIIAFLPPAKKEEAKPRRNRAVCVPSTCQWFVTCSERGFYFNGRGVILSFSASSQKNIRKFNYRKAELEDFSSSVFSLPLMTAWMLNLSLPLLK